MDYFSNAQLTLDMDCFSNAHSEVGCVSDWKRHKQHCKHLKARVVAVPPSNLCPLELDLEGRPIETDASLTPKPKLSHTEMCRIQEAIERLQSKNFVDPDEVCTICIEGVDEDTNLGNMKLPCGHVFHFRCVVPWLQQGGTCPCCRASIIVPPID